MERYSLQYYCIIIAFVVFLQWLCLLSLLLIITVYYYILNIVVITVSAFNASMQLVRYHKEHHTCEILVLCCSTPLWRDLQEHKIDIMLYYGPPNHFQVFFSPRCYTYSILCCTD